MTYLAEGLAFGMMLQLAVGPVCVSVLQKGMTGSFLQAFQMVWGVVLADAAYILLALLGISSLLQLEPLRLGIGLAGAALLMYFGVQNLRAKSPELQQSVDNSDSGSSLKYGFLLTLSNPLTILFWSGVFGGLIASTKFSTPSAAYAFGSGCILATLVFLTVIAGLGKFIGTFFRQPQLMLWLNRIVGLFLVAFAIKLTIDVLGH